MQPQTMNAVTIAQKSQSCIWGIVVFSVAQHHYQPLYTAFRVLSLAHQLRQLGDVRGNASRLTLRQATSPLIAVLALPRNRPMHVSESMRWLVKQFELGGQHRDTHIRLGAREVRLKCV